MEFFLECKSHRGRAIKEVGAVLGEVGPAGNDDKMLRDDVGGRQDKMEFPVTIDQREGQFVSKNGEPKATCRHLLILDGEEEEIPFFKIHLCKVLGTGVDGGRRVQHENVVPKDVRDTNDVVDTHLDADIGFIAELYVCADRDIEYFIQPGKACGRHFPYRGLYQRDILLVEEPGNGEVTGPTTLP